MASLFRCPSSLDDPPIFPPSPFCNDTMELAAYLHHRAQEIGKRFSLLSQRCQDSLHPPEGVSPVPHDSFGVPHRFPSAHIPHTHKNALSCADEIRQQDTISVPDPNSGEFRSHGLPMRETLPEDHRDHHRKSKKFCPLQSTVDAAEKGPRIKQNQANLPNSASCGNGFVPDGVHAERNIDGKDQFIAMSRPSASRNQPSPISMVSPPAKPRPRPVARSASSPSQFRQIADMESIQSSTGGDREVAQLDAHQNLDLHDNSADPIAHTGAGSRVNIAAVSGNVQNHAIHAHERSTNSQVDAKVVNVGTPSLNTVSSAESLDGDNNVQRKDNTSTGYCSVMRRGTSANRDEVTKVAGKEACGNGRNVGDNGGMKKRKRRVAGAGDGRGFGEGKEGGLDLLFDAIEAVSAGGVIQEDEMERGAGGCGYVRKGENGCGQRCGQVMSLRIHSHENGREGDDKAEGCEGSWKNNSGSNCRRGLGTNSTGKQQPQKQEPSLLKFKSLQDVSEMDVAVASTKQQKRRTVMHSRRQSSKASNDEEKKQQTKRGKKVKHGNGVETNAAGKQLGNVVESSPAEAAMVVGEELMAEEMSSSSTSPCLGGGDELKERAWDVMMMQEDDAEDGGGISNNNKKKAAGEGGGRCHVLPMKFSDSVLQPWKKKDRGFKSA